MAGILGSIGGLSGLAAVLTVRHQARNLEAQSSKLAAEAENTRIDTASSLIHMLERQIERLTAERDALLQQREIHVRRIAELEAQIEDYQQTKEFLEGLS